MEGGKTFSTVEMRVVGALGKNFPTVENTKLAPTRRAFVKYCVSVGCVEGWPERGDGTSGGRACGSPPEGEAVGHAGLVGGVTNVKKVKNNKRVE